MNRQDYVVRRDFRVYVGSCEGEGVPVRLGDTLTHRQPEGVLTIYRAGCIIMGRVAMTLLGMRALTAAGHVERV